MTVSSGWQIWWANSFGLIIDLNNEINFFLRREGLEGFDDQEREQAYSRVPYRHGVVHHGEPYAPHRYLSVAIDVTGRDAPDTRGWMRYWRRYITPYWGDGSPGVLTVQDVDNGTYRAIECKCTRMLEIYRAPAAKTIVFHFVSEDAFFYDPTERVETIGVSGPGGLTFPITFPITFTSADIDETISVDNAGEAPTWPTVRVYGPGDNPSLENTTTGKTMAITQTLDSGDYIEIDMEAATVMFSDATDGSTTSIIENISDASEFWELAVGENEIEVNVENAVSGSVRFSYNLRYLGV